MMQVEERLRALLSANPDTLAAIDAALSGVIPPDRTQSLRLYRMGEAAAELRISRVSLWRCISEGRIKAVEIRKGSHRIPAEELRRFVTVGQK